MNHNKHITEVINGIKNAVKNASNQNELRQAILPAVELGDEFTYRHQRYWVAISALALVTFLVAATRWLPRMSDHHLRWDPKYYYTSPASLLGFAALVISLVLVIVIVKRRNAKKNLSKEIARMDALYDYGFDGRRLDCEYLYAVQRSFREFKRGNYSRRFLLEYATLPDANEEAHYYKFEYVDKETRQVTSTDSDGRTTTRTETTYHYFYRYGLVLNFGLYKNITVASDYRPSTKRMYSPASIAFNKIYDLGAENELQLSRFLKPAVVEAFIEIDKHFSSLNMEINEDGLMCISFDNDDVINPITKFSLDQPAEFFEELKHSAQLPKLTKIMDFYQTLKKYSDNNFLTPQTSI
ncbi:hypothetical protein KW429_11410 [Vibrio fluvialis]|nr:hypothetical protein [Vibrio fluvialis]